MKWLTILLALASLGGTPSPGASHGKQRCSTSTAAKQHCKKAKPKPKAKKPNTKQPVAGTPTTPAAPRHEAPRSDPADPGAMPTATATATPKPGATPTPTATPTATPTYPRRTAVDLVEWDIRSSYLTLAAGRVTFNANNLGEDDHNLSIRGGGHEYGKVDLAPGESSPLALDLPAGSYTLYCSLIGHEEAGMRAAIDVR